MAIGATAIDANGRARVSWDVDPYRVAVVAPRASERRVRASRRLPARARVTLARARHSRPRAPPLAASLAQTCPHSLAFAVPAPSPSPPRSRSPPAAARPSRGRSRRSPPRAPPDRGGDRRPIGETVTDIYDTVVEAVAPAPDEAPTGARRGARRGAGARAPRVDARSSTTSASRAPGAPTPRRTRWRSNPLIAAEASSAT